MGEGTNRSIDLDEYDLYYYHLFIWDREEEKIVGAYRVGKGKEIIDRYGMKGFYINSLFKMRKEMLPVLYESIELGRSFITEEYQRKPLPLFMLMKGILYFFIEESGVSLSDRPGDHQRKVYGSIERADYAFYSGKSL